MPYDDWGMAYGGADGKLQVAGGVTANSSGSPTRRQQYDPATNTWTALPNANNAEYRGGGGCGLTRSAAAVIGGIPARRPPRRCPATASAERGAVPWLSENTTGFTLAPGQSVTVAVTLDSVQGGPARHLHRRLSVARTRPTRSQPVGITLHGEPAQTWGEMTGTVTDAKTGKPIAGATVQVGTAGGSGQASYTTMTDAAATTSGGWTTGTTRCRSSPPGTATPSR